jgi:polynucleotide 5'-kinase involved in rRNA processing
LKEEEEIKNIEDAQELKEEEKGRMEKLKNLEVKIRVEEITPEDIIEDISKQIEEKFNKEPDVMVIGKTDDGAPIYAFTLEKQLVSDIGFSVIQSSTGPIYEIVQLEHTDSD